MMGIVDMRGTVFEISLGHASGKLLRPNEFNLWATTPYVYNRFVGACCMFPHHDQVSLYFSKHIYCEFVLGMRLDYMSTPSTFYGSGRGYSYEHPQAHRDPTFVPLPPTLVPPPCEVIVFLDELVNLLQFRVEEMGVTVENMHIALSNLLHWVYMGRDLDHPLHMQGP